MTNLFQRYVKTIITNPIKIVLSIFLLAAVAAYWLYAYSPLKLDTNFTTLLPDDLPCVIESKRISKLVGSTDYLYVAIESPVASDNLAFADDIAKKIAKLSEINWVTTKEDKTVFRNNRLLYLETKDLETIVKQVKKRVDYEKKISNPFYINLDDEKAPDISFSNILDKYEEKLGKHGAKGIMKTKAPKDTINANVDVGDYLATADGKIVTVKAMPSKPAVDMEFGRHLVEKIKKLIEETNPKRNPEMNVEVAGSYRNRYLEYNYIVKDILLSIVTSLGLIVLIVIVFFRRFRSVALIFIPLIIGIIFTVAITALTLQRLNMVTALIFAVLLGLGIDFGVHMTTRYLDERGRGKSLEESLSLAMLNTGRAILTAGLTTAGALAVLIMARFKGFSEFGIIATLGIIICLLVYSLLIPSMAVLMEKVSSPKPWRKKTLIPEKEIKQTKQSRGFWGLILAGIFIISAVGLFGLSKVEFEYNFYNLTGRKKISTNIKYGKTLSQSSSPVVAVLPTAQKAKTFSKHLEEEIDADKSEKKMLKSVFSIFSFIPDDQNTKLILLKELKGYLDQVIGMKKISKKTKDRINEIYIWTKTSKITIKQLPEWVVSKFTEKDGTIGRMVFLFPNVNEYHVDRMAKFYDKYGLIDVPGTGKIRPAASGFIMVEVVRAVQRDGIMMTIVATIIVLILLLIDLRSFTRALLVFVPLLVGLIWTGGLMGFFDIKVGLYNMLVLPTLLGIGIDASVHFYHSYREFGKGSIKYILKTTGVTIFIAAATTGVGFVGMIIVSHLGLQSIGILAVLGIICCLCGSLITLPILLALLESVDNKKNSID